MKQSYIKPPIYKKPFEMDHIPFKKVDDNYIEKLHRLEQRIKESE